MNDDPGEEGCSSREGFYEDWARLGRSKRKRLQEEEAPRGWGSMMRLLKKENSTRHHDTTHFLNAP